MVGVIIMMILMGKAVQSWSVVSQRDREEEFLSRSRQIVYALERYQKDNGSLPTKLEQLMEPGPKGNSRYVRHPWKDPLTGGDWVLLWVAPDGASLFRSDGKPSSTGSFRTAGQPGNQMNPTAALNLNQLSIPLGSGGYDADKARSLISASRALEEQKQKAQTPFGSTPSVSLGNFDLDSSILSTQGIGPIAGVATSFTGPAFREWKGHGDYSGYEISIFSFKDDKKGPEHLANPDRNLWEMPGTAVPDPLSPEGRKLMGTDATALGGTGIPKR
jgi:type II secretory pathway pseudopilin PulG